jgi:hypothetical protein
MTRIIWIAVRAIVLIGITWLVAAPVWAQPIARDDVPPELVPWIPWVLEDAGEDACTKVNEQATCVWPGRLSLVASATGVRFELEVVVEARSRIALPGNTDLWPEDVKIGAAEAIVTGAEGVPQVWLGAGVHQVSGRIPYGARPDVLPVPTDIGKVSLELDGAAVATRWESDGKLWLTKDGTSVAPEDPAAKEQARLDLEVFRRIEDGVPVIVTTFLDLRVSGAPREVNLGKPSLAGGVLLALTANGLPIRMDGNGDMVLGVKAGKHRVELRARHPAPLASLSLEARPEPWPKSEIWALSPRPEQRQVEPKGIPSIDPSRTNAPSEWGQLRMFKADAPATLLLETTRRGNPEPPPNKLRLSRDIFLDAERSGFTVLDRIEGDMTRDFRLDFTGPGELGHVALRGHREQLISVSGDRSLPGVELRDGNVSFVAEWRSEDRLSTLPAIGWTTDVESLATDLHLPPGWDLVKVTGADGALGEWGADWEVIDLAILLGIALAAGRVFSPRWGVLVAAGLVCAQQVQPGLRWWVLAAVALAAVFRLATPDGRLARWSRFGMRAAALVAGWLALNLAAREGRHALWPATEAAEQLELEQEEKEAEMMVASSADDKEGGTGTRAKGEEGSMGAPSSKATGMRYGIRGPSSEEDARAAERSTDEIVQTGHGVPSWGHRTATVHFSSAVDRGRTIRFFLLSPWQSAVISLVRAGLVIALAWLLLREAFRRGGPRSSLRGAPYRAAAAAAAALLGLLATTGEARADQPSAEVLTELKTRLTRPPPCAPACADVASMKVEAKGRTLVVKIRAHAEATSAIALPSSAAAGAEAWVPTRIDIDGKPATALRAQGSGVVLLRIGRGTHDIELEGPVSGTSFTFSLGTRPHRVRTALTGWTVEGLDDDGAPSGDALVFHKTGETEPPPDGPAPPPEAPPETVAIPPWLEVTRTLDLGVSWNVTTVVKRISPTGPAISVGLPILEGERVVEGGARMGGGKVTIDLGREAKEARFVSAIAPRDTIVLQAHDEEPWTETWIVRCSAIWQCRSDGVPPIENRADGALTATFKPWPGEKLTLHLVKPPTAKGISTTIEGAVLRLETADQTTEASLAMDVRTTTGATQPITLPAGARITELTVNGKAQPSPDAAALRIPLSPGSSSIMVKFKLDGGRDLFYRAPAVDLGSAATNARVEVVAPQGRTVLWTGGGTWGPVVLVWPFMLLLATIGVVLSRLPGSPLAPKQWLVLAPGLTQAPPIVGAIVVAWIFVVSHRRDRDASTRLADGTKQVGIAALTFAALVCFAACIYVGVTRPRNLLETEVWRSANASSFAGYGKLVWYFDKSDAALAQPWFVSTPEWVWKVLVLAWAVAAFMALWPFLRSAAARYAEGGVFRRPLASAVPSPMPAPMAPVAVAHVAPSPPPVDAAPEPDVPPSDPKPGDDDPPP